jgi:hypothetical protein
MGYIVTIIAIGLIVRAKIAARREIEHRLVAIRIAPENLRQMRREGGR